jgi:hypothetical protein
MSTGPSRTSPNEFTPGARFEPLSMSRGSRGDDEHLRNQRMRRLGPLLVVLVIVAAIAAVLVWHSVQSPSPVGRVEYVNDTAARVIVAPCGSKTRCVIEPGGRAMGTAPPSDATTMRISDATTHKIRGCISYETGQRSVQMSDADLGAPC